jgi:thiol-disulfide isomerase/thioredoxin
MKPTILSVFLLSLIVSCSETGKNPSTQKMIITGQVSNFNEVSEHDVVEFIYEDLLAGQETVVSYIDSDGQFRFELNIVHPTEFYLKYSGLMTFFISPGDSIHIDIDGDCWGKVSESSEEEYRYYHVSGTAEKMNSDVAAYSAFFSDSLFSWKFQDSILRISTPTQYKDFQNKQTKKMLERTNQFNREHQTCTQFQEWVSMKLKFREWDDLMRYRWIRPMYDKGDRNEFLRAIPEDYFLFLEGWDKENKDYLQSMDYLCFLHEYSMYTNQLIPLDSQQFYSALWKEEFEKSAAYKPRYYAQVETGLLKDILISKYYYMLLDAKYYEKMKSIFDASLIEDETLKSLILEKFNHEKNLFENPEFAAGSKLNQFENENNFLQALVQRYPDKVIYIDFWAPWCSPCMGEMPYAKKLKEQFVGKEVVFIYLANQCEESAWKTTIAEKKIEGEHYFLTDEQYAGLKAIFEIRGIPHYALIDKKGNIVNENAPRPSSGKELIELINSNL